MDGRSVKILTACQCNMLKSDARNIVLPRQQEMYKLQTQHSQ